MKPIKELGGITGCPSDAVKEVIAVCDFVSLDKGGEGAVREFAEFLICENRGNEDSFIEGRCLETAQFLSQLQGKELSLGRHVVNDEFYYDVIEYETTGEKDKPFESHRKYVDVQMLLDGEEIMQVIDISRIKKNCNYDKDKDIVLYTASNIATSTILRPGSIMILYPRDAHRSMLFKGRVVVKKVVGKVLINK